MIDFLGRTIPSGVEEVLSPASTALVIYDMQNDFCKPDGLQVKSIGPIVSQGITEKIAGLLAAARRAKVRVIYTQYTNYSDYQSYSDPMLYRMRSSLGTGSKTSPLTAVHGTWGWEVVEELRPSADELRVLKYRRDAFVGTNFDNLLRTNRVKTVVCTGIALELGILPTALTASFLDYYVVVPKDAVSGLSQERMDAAMKLLESSVTLSDSSTIAGLWASAAARAPDQSKK